MLKVTVPVSTTTVQEDEGGNKYNTTSRGLLSIGTSEYTTSIR